MKRWLIIASALIIVSIISFYAYQLLYKAEVGSLESLVPDQVIYYLYCFNLDSKTKELQSTPLFQQIFCSSAYKKFIDPKLQKLKEKIPFASDLFERDACLAVFSLSEMAARKSNIVDIGDFLFLLRLDPQKHTTIKKYIADFYVSISDQGQVGYKKYNGIKITNYMLPKAKLNIYYAFLSDVLVISNSDNILQKSIDLFRDKVHKSLLDSADFQKATAKIRKDTLLWGYGNSRNYYQEALRAYAHSSLKSRHPLDAGFADSLMKMDYFVSLMNVLRGYAFYLDYSDLRDGFVLRSYHDCDSSMDKDGLLEVIAYKEGVDNNTLGLIPRDIIAYYGGSQNLLTTWKFLKKVYASFDELMKAEMRADPRYNQYRDKIEEVSFENYLKSIESFLGVDIEAEILSLLGKNFGLILVSMDDAEIPFVPRQTPTVYNQQKTHFVFPGVYAFCELKDASKTEQLMDELTKRFVDKVNQSFKAQVRKGQEVQGLPESKNIQEQVDKQQAAEQKNPIEFRLTSYNEESIHWLELLSFPIELFKPNYCILDKYLIFSLSLDITQRVIDTYNNKQSTFNSNLDFQSIKDKLTPDYSNFIFFDFTKMINNLKLTKFYQDLESRLLHTAKGDFSKEDLESILNVLNNISFFAFANNLLDNDTIESSLYIKVQGL